MTFYPALFGNIKDRQYCSILKAFLRFIPIFLFPLAARWPEEDLEIILDIIVTRRAKNI